MIDVSTFPPNSTSLCNIISILLLLGTCRMVDFNVLTPCIYDDQDTVLYDEDEMLKGL